MASFHALLKSNHLAECVGNTDVGARKKLIFSLLEEELVQRDSKNSSSIRRSANRLLTSSELAPCILIPSATRGFQFRSRFLFNSCNTAFSIQYE